ncbi:hypothetical protein GQ44DRAFT_832174 [Phaeosphaeriaceae sp. PMI808]|nr:hypothetical protein GQ44DRAFT_832174 [Phaeosphaeriaceae sp. PMI808]
MASCSSPPAAQKRRLQAIRKATRRSDRIRAATEKSSKSWTDTKLKARYSLKQETKKRSRDPENHTSTGRPRKRLRTQPSPATKQAKRKRHQDEVQSSRLLSTILLMQFESTETTDIIIN